VLITNPVPFTLISFDDFSGGVDALLSLDFVAVEIIGGLDAAIEKSPALATPPARTLSTQFVITGISCSTGPKLNWSVCVFPLATIRRDLRIRFMAASGIGADISFEFATFPKTRNCV